MLLAACGGNEPAARPRTAPSGINHDGGERGNGCGEPAARPAGSAPRPVSSARASPPVTDSTIPSTDAYPAVIQRLADSAGVKAFVVNAGLSGETSAGALRRVDWLLKEKPDVVVIETGANDGLRGLNPDSTAGEHPPDHRTDPRGESGGGILLVQMEAPTNLGPAYTRAFPRVVRQGGRRGEGHALAVPAGPRRGDRATESGRRHPPDARRGADRGAEFVAELEGGADEEVSGESDAGCGISTRCGLRKRNSSGEERGEGRDSLRSGESSLAPRRSPRPPAVTVAPTRSADYS